MIYGLSYQPVNQDNYNTYYIFNLHMQMSRNEQLAG